MSNAILFRAAFGIPGDISRQSVATIEAQPFDSANAFSNYGLPGKIVSGKFRPITTSADVVYGFLVRPFPLQENVWPTNPAFSSTPPVGGVANILRRGYIAVKVQAGTGSAALGSAVYVRYAATSGGQIQGGIEGASSGGNNASIPNCQFMGAPDSNGYAEIFFDNPGQPAAI